MISLYISLALKFFFLFTPFFALSMFLAMTAEKGPRERRALAHRVAFATVVIAGALLYFGPLIFRVFGITVDAFRIGAGILLLLTAISLMNPKEIAGSAEEDISVVPLAMPVVVGPASCGAIMVSATELAGFVQKAVGFAALASALGAIWGILLLGTWFERRLGRRGISILMRLTVLILAALSAQMVMYAEVGPGDEVIVPTNTFIATVAYPLSVGAKLVFADIDPKTVNMDPKDVARKITKRTKIIVPVHIGGYPCDMDAIMKLAKRHDLVVMEDAAHGFGGEYKGRKLGTIGHFGCFSMHEVKNCTSLGEGGVFVSNVKAYRAEARRARFLGVDFSHRIENWLYDVSPIRAKKGTYQASNNASVTEIQALALLQQLKRYPKILAERRREATYMTKRLSGVPGIVPQALGGADIKPTFHLYRLQIDPKVVGGDVQALKRKLEEKGVTNIPHFGPIYRFATSIAKGNDVKRIAATCPVTEYVFDRCYTHLPIYGLTKGQLSYMADAILESVAEMKAGR